MLLRGFHSLLNSIKILTKVSQNTVFEISHIMIVDTDFQIEGLYFAIRGWLATYLNIEIPKVEGWFDKKNNRYHFEENLV